jgi:hypothetical protein
VVFINTPAVCSRDLIVADYPCAAQDASKLLDEMKNAPFDFVRQSMVSCRLFQLKGILIQCSEMVSTDCLF